MAKHLVELLGLRGVHAQECLWVPVGREGAREVRLPALLHQAWHGPISIISRQRCAPFAAHGAARQAAKGGSSLAGF